MSLELSIFKRLLQEAILSQSEFLDKVSQTYNDRARLPDDKILARLLELIDETQILSLTGKANKKSRKKVENFIDDQVKAMTAGDGSSISIKGIRKLYDGIVKYLATNESEKINSDVSFDQCIRYADIFLKSIYPNLSSDQKVLVDSGDFPYNEVFNLVLNFQKLSSDRPIDVDVIYEDEVIKVVYPLDSHSFSEYVKSNLPPIIWKKPWCTMDSSQWSSYHEDFFIAVMYVKEHYKKDHSHSLISLKLSHEGDILYQETCDYYNKHMNANLKRYLSEKCIKDCSDYFKSFFGKIETKIYDYIDDLDSLVKIGEFGEFANRLMFIDCYTFLIKDNTTLQTRIEKTLSSLPETFLSNTFLEIASSIDCVGFADYTDNSFFIKKYIREFLLKDAKGNKNIFNLFLEKACRRNLNPKYASSFIRLLNFLRDKIDSKNLFSRIGSKEASLIILNSLNSNNPDFFNEIAHFYLPDILKNIEISKEEKDEIIKNVFLSKSHISFYKENFDDIKKGNSRRFINDNLSLFVESHEEISKRANTDLLNIEEVTKDVVLDKIQSACFKASRTKRGDDLKDTSNFYENEILNIFSSINIEYNTSITIEEFLLNYNNNVQSKLLVIFFDNNNDEFLRKNLKEKFVNILIRDIMRETRCLFGIRKFDDIIVLLDKIIEIILRTNRSDIWEKLIEATASELEKTSGGEIGHGIYTAVFGTNVTFDNMSTEFSIKYPNMLSLYKIPGFKRKLQNRIIASKHEVIFKIIFIYSTEYKDILEDSLFEDQIKFIKENFNFPAFINLLSEFFVKEENGLFKLLSDEQKARINAITKQYLDIDVFKKSFSEEPEELVRDYVKTQL